LTVEVCVGTVHSVLIRVIIRFIIWQVLLRLIQAFSLVVSWSGFCHTGVLMEKERICVSLILFHLGILFSMITAKGAHAELMNPLAKAEMIAYHVIRVWLGFH